MPNNNDLLLEMIVRGGIMSRNEIHVYFESCGRKKRAANHAILEAIKNEYIIIYKTKNQFKIAQHFEKSCSKR